MQTKQRLILDSDLNLDNEEVTIPVGVVASFIYCSILKGFSNWKEKYLLFWLISVIAYSPMITKNLVVI